MALPKLVLIAICSMIGLSVEWSVASAHWYRPIASVGTFNALLSRNTPGFAERKQQLINTVSSRYQ